MYQPPTIAPMLGSCSASYSTLSNDMAVDEGAMEVVSLLSSVVVTCDGWEFADGGSSLLTQIVYFEVRN